MDKVSVVVVAGGQGARFGTTIPKAFVPLGDAPLFLHSVRAFAAHPATAEIVVVVPPHFIDSTADILDGAGPGVPSSVVCGGVERWQSVENGVVNTVMETEWVCVHDAARPFVTPAVIDAVLALAPAYRAVVTATRVTDTIRRFDGERSEGTVDRSRLARIGTPQLFHKESLLDTFEMARTRKERPTDEAMLFEWRGMDVGIAWGDPLNFKITTREDMALAEALLVSRDGH